MTNPADPTLAILERNVENFPTFSLSGRSGDTIQFTDGDTEWTVRNPPGPGARDVYVAICKLYNDARRPEHRRVYTTLPELARLMGMSKGGTQWRLLTDSLEALKRVQIQAKGTFTRNGKRVRRETFDLIEKVVITSPIEGDSAETTVVVIFSETIANSIRSGYYRLLNTDTYFALNRPLARSLYAILDARRHQGERRVTPVLTFDLSDLRERLNLQVSAPSQVRRSLNEAHEELRSQGFISEWRYGSTGVPGRSLAAYNIIYTFSDTQTLLPLSRTSTSEAEIRAERIRQIVDLLQDSSQVALYARIVAVMSDTQIEGLLASTRELLRENATPESARRIFIATARRRIQEAGKEI